MGRWKQDLRVEQEFAAYMDRYCYPRLKGEKGFSSVERVRDVERQKEGIDVILKTKKAEILVDEKAQSYHINQNLPTFAFELSYLAVDGTERVGWLLNDTLLTTHYFLLWPFAREPARGRRLQMEDITLLDCLVIEKAALLSMLAGLELTAERVWAALPELRRAEHWGKYPTGQPGIYYYVSDPERYAEEPINLVIAKSRLRNVAAMEYEVRPEGLKRLK